MGTFTFKRLHCSVLPLLRIELAKGEINKTKNKVAIYKLDCGVTDRPLNKSVRVELANLDPR